MEDLPELPEPSDIVAFLRRVDACFAVADMRSYHLDGDQWTTEGVVDLKEASSFIAQSGKVFGYDTRGSIRILHHSCEQLHEDTNQPVGCSWLSQWMFELPEVVIRATVCWDTAALELHDKGSAIINREFTEGKYLEVTRYMTQHELFALGAIAMAIGWRNVVLFR